MRKLIVTVMALAVLVATTATASAGTRVYPVYPVPDETRCSAEHSVNIANCAEVLVDTDPLHPAE